MSDRRRAVLALTCLGLIVAIQAVALGFYWVPVLADTDANAYHGAARMLETHGRLHQVVEDEVAYVGKMWVVNEEGRIYPKYPPFYPVLVAAANTVLGGRAGMMVTPVCAVLTVIGTFVLCRTLLPWWGAVLGAFAVATNPVVSSFGVRQHSHGVSLACLTWAFALLLLSRRRSGRWQLAVLFGSGLLVGCSTGSRYADALLALPALVWIASRPRRRVAMGAAWLLGFAIPCVLLAYYHWQAFGHPLRTAYALTDEQSAFGLGHLLRHLRLYAPAVMTFAIGPLFVLSCLAFVAEWARDWKKGLFWATWLLPTALLYMAYYWVGRGHVISFIRFFLPLVPPCILLAVLFARELTSALAPGTWTRRTMVAALFLVQGGWGLPTAVEELESVYSVHARIHDRVEFIREHVPAGSVLFCEVNLLDSLDLDRQYDLYWDFLLDQDSLRRRLRKSLRGGPDGLQTKRAEIVEEELLDVDPATFRARIRERVDRALDEGREAFLLSKDQVGSFRATFPEYVLEEVAVLPTRRARYRLFRPALPTMEAEGLLLRIERENPDGLPR